MIPRTSRPLVPLLGALALGLGLLTGCGGADGPGSTPEPDLPSTPTLSPTPTPTPTPTPLATPTPAPTPTASEDPEGDGDGVDDDLPATAGGGVCGELDNAEIGAVVRAAVTGRGLGGTPGCEFVAGRKVTVTVVDRTAAAAGGMAGARNEATSTVEGEPEDVPGIGGAAFVVTGTVFGGPEVQGSGAVRVGGRIVLVSYTQHRAEEATTVRATVLGLLREIAGELD